MALKFEEGQPFEIIVSGLLSDFIAIIEGNPNTPTVYRDRLKTAKELDAPIVIPMEWTYECAGNVTNNCGLSQMYGFTLGGLHEWGKRIQKPKGVAVIPKELNGAAIVGTGFSSDSLWQVLRRHFYQDMPQYLEFQKIVQARVAGALNTAGAFLSCPISYGPRYTIWTHLFAKGLIENKFGSVTPTPWMNNPNHSGSIIQGWFWIPPSREHLHIKRPGRAAKVPLLKSITYTESKTEHLKRGMSEHVLKAAEDYFLQPLRT